MPKKRTPRKSGEPKGKRQPKVAIPLPFEKAVEGLLAVRPDKKRKPS